MARVRERIETARRALASLKEVAFLKTYTDIERDAAIQRFEFTVEVVWKACQAHLEKHEGLEARSPKSTVRAARDALLLTDEQSELALRMIDDRNLTTHTYNETTASDILTRLSAYATLLEAWLSAIESSLRNR